MEQYTYTEDIAIRFTDASSDKPLFGSRLGVFTIGSKEKRAEVKKEQGMLKL